MEGLFTRFEALVEKSTEIGTKSVLYELGIETGCERSQLMIPSHRGAQAHLIFLNHM